MLVTFAFTLKKPATYFILVMTSFIGMTYWTVRREVGNNIPDFRDLRERSAPALPKLFRKNICELNWKTRNFDVDFYEASWKSIETSKTEKFHGEKRTQSTPHNRNPTYKLHPDKFLIPSLEGGPNNQVFCMRETLFIAIKLNRTLVIPKFYKHFTDSQAHESYSFIYPGHRVNIEDVCKLVSCITLQQFQETCNGKIDVLMAFTHHIAIRRLQKNVGMRTESDLEILPHNKTKLLKREKITSDLIPILLDSEARCMAYEKPLFNMLFSVTAINGNPLFVPQIRALEDDFTSEDVDLMRKIVQATQAPEYIVKLASQFIKFLVKDKSLLTIHWRYNKGDYLERCQGRLRKNKTKHIGQYEFCKMALSLTSDNVSRSIEEKIKFLQQNYEKEHPQLSKIRHIYIAAPPSERETISNVSKELLKKKGWIVHSSIELEKFVKSRFNSCNVLVKHFNDIISSVEMEISANGIVFLRSQRSTWSSNVNLSRKICTRPGTLPKLDNVVI